MGINRELWLYPFSKKNIPNWICPKCKLGILRPLESGFVSNEDGSTVLELKKYPDFPEEYKKFKYVLSLRCNNIRCEELVVSCGTGYAELDYDEEIKEILYDELFVPEYFYPPACIFSIPKGCPEKISSEINSSFKLFFTSSAASANYVRKTIDAILTDKGVKRYLSARGKRKIISLHDRILDFGKAKPEIAKSLLAIKWLGNEGSHADSLTKNDILDAYEILESVLDDLYIGYRRSVEMKVSKINKTKRALHPST